MDAFLDKLTYQATNYAIRTGIAVTASYVFRQSSRLVKNVGNREERSELIELQRRLESKIQVISPAIDMIELIAARGNTSLESAVSLTKSIRLDVQALGQRLARAAATEELIKKGGKSPIDRSQNDAEIRLILNDIKRLLVRIEDAVPLMNLAITTSGAKLSTNLPATVSPSRLLQASTFLTAGDTQYHMSPSQAVQIGPTFTLSMYMLFASHLRPHDVEGGIRETTWKEVMHKARLKLRRVPMDWATKPGTNTRKPQVFAEASVDEFAYQLLIVEDLDDGRVHTFEENERQPHSYEGIDQAGIREILPIHQISKIFYADTGKILNISTEGEDNSPVLLLKRDVNAVPPRRMMEREEADYGYTRGELDQEGEEDEVDEVQAQLDAQLNEANTPTNMAGSVHEDSIPEEWRLPQGLDPEWIAFEVYNEDDTSDSESEAEAPSTPTKTSTTEQMASLSLNSHETPTPSKHHHHKIKNNTTTLTNPLFNNIRTSLSLLETLLRLMSLQQFQQQSHLAITDELLNFFLEESATTGAGGDEHHRQRLRTEARRKVGWDPYDESPVKRRGEDYQYGYGSPAAGPYSRGEDSEYLGYGGSSPHSPSERARGLRLRSREATPETPVQGRMSDRRRLNVVRGDRDEGVRRGSPLSRRSPTVPADEGGSDVE